MSGFKENVLATLVYYDVFDFPLKAEEIFTKMVKFDHLGNYPSPQKGQWPSGLYWPITNYQLLQRELDQLILNRVINRVGKYYFLFDREYLVPLRLKREKIAKRKWRIAKHAVWWLRFVPYVRAVFVSGSLAMNDTNELSDIDVLIVVKHGRIWLGRLLILGTLSLLRVRRRGTDHIAPDKVCANHFITDNSLNIPFKSVYTAQIYSSLVPIYLKNEELIQKFKKDNNWVLDYVYKWNIKDMTISKLGLIKIFIKTSEVILDTKLGAWFESLARNYQSKRIAKNPNITQAGGRVIFNDEQLEFHPHSIEIQIIKSYNERLIKIKLPQLAMEKDSGLDRIVS